MSITEDFYLPTDEELTVEEIKLSGNILKAGANHLGRSCEFQNNEFMLCRKELGDPRFCLKEGKAVTSCALNFFRQVKKSCADEFMQYAECVDKSSTKAKLSKCRKTQAVFDKCMSDNLNIDRLPYDYYTRVQIHKTARPRPPPREKTVYEDATPYLPDGTEKPPAKYGSRFHWMW